MMTETEPDVEPAFHVTVPGHLVLPPELPLSPKKLLTRLQANEHWEALAQHSSTHVEPVPYVGSAEIRFPAKDIDHWQVGAVLTNDGRLGARINAYWATIRGKTLFEGASVWDAFMCEQVFYRQMGPLEVWLSTFAPLGRPEPKKKPTDKDLLTGEDWSSAA